MINKLKIGYGVFLSRFLGIHKPLFVSWDLTNRCNCNCIYCDMKKIKVKELSTEDVFSILIGLKKSGTKRISILGGEPLLRKDIPQIISKIKNLGMHLTITTNGKLVPKYIGSVSKSDLVKLSYDGPKKIHENQRGKGTYDYFVRALECLKQNNVKVVLNTTLTRNTLDYLDEIIIFAVNNETLIKFQPVSIAHCHYSDISSLIPSNEEKRKIIRKIMSLKKRYKNIVNSEDSIKNFYSPKKITNCVAGKILCKISPDGTVYPCTIKEYRHKGNNILKQGIRKSFKNSRVSGCDKCLCSSTLELNQLYNLKLRSILNILKTKF